MFKFPDVSNCALVVVDIQERLIKAMDENKYRKKMITSVNIANEMELPLVVTEQYPRGLGNTIEEIKEILLPSVEVLEKTSFSCWGATGFVEAVKNTEATVLVVIGMESHVCVLQTVLEAVERGYKVVVPVDCVSSRSELDKTMALEQMKEAGVMLTTLEALAFSWLKGAKHPSFRTISKLIV